jgi:hypothetical protein
MHTSLCGEKVQLKSQKSLDKNKKRKWKFIYRKVTLFYVLGLTLGLVLHGLYVNVVDGHDIGLKKNLQSLSINHILVSFYIHNCYRSTWRDW